MLMRHQRTSQSDEQLKTHGCPNTGFTSISEPGHGRGFNGDPRIGIDTVLVMASEIGADLSRFATVKHFCAWLGLAPPTKISGGKNLSGKSHKVNNRVGQALRQAASTPAVARVSLVPTIVHGWHAWIRRKRSRQRRIN